MSDDNGASAVTVPLVEITPDARNANRGTERGRYMLEKSLEKLGAGRSILLDKHGNIIAGNKTAEVAAAIGLEDVVIVKTDGRQLVAVQRTDLDLDSIEGREMAYADNRVGQVDLDFNPEQIALDLESGLELGDFWQDWEFVNIGAMKPEEANDPNAEWVGMPEFEQEDKSSYKRLIVHFASADDVREFAEMIEQPIGKKTKYIWHPRQVRADLKALSYVDES